jgi:hypothetical protein
MLAAVVAAAVLVGAGCSGGDDPVTPPTASSTTAGDNTKQVCADAKALGEEYKKKVGDILARAVQKTDEAEIEKVLNEVVPLSKEYKTKFEALGRTANNQQLKDALTVLAKDMDNASAETAGEAAGAAEETLTGICGA